MGLPWGLLSAGRAWKISSGRCLGCHKRSEPAQLAPSDAKEQQLYPKLTPDKLCNYKAEPSHPIEETRFDRLYLQMYSFKALP